MEEMTVQMIIDIAQLSLFTFLKVAGPMLVASMVVGISVSLFQSMTQINEMTLTFVPKIVTVIVTAVIFLPWIVATLTKFTQDLIYFIPRSLHM